MSNLAAESRSIRGQTAAPRSPTRRQTAATAVTAEVREAVAQTLSAALGALRNDKRLPRSKHFTVPVDGHGSRARDANQQHVDLGIYVLCHALAHPEQEQVDI